MKDIEQLLQTILTRLDTALMLACKYDLGCANEIQEAIDAVFAAKKALKEGGGGNG